MFKKAVLYCLLAGFVFAAGGSTLAQADEDVEGSKDHPMISRYEGSYIKAYEQVGFDRAKFPSGREDGELQTTTLEGKPTKILYVVPEGISVLQVQRNYQMALQDAGFEILYEFDQFGGRGLSSKYVTGMEKDGSYYGKEGGYLLARMPGEEGDIYVSIATSESRYHDGLDNHLRVLEEKPMPTGKVKVDIDAEAMADDLEESGSVRIYGIHFDTDKATIKEKSESTLAEMAALMDQESNLSLHVVGHTDAVGDIAYNLDLSRERAEAVVAFLSSEHGVGEDRLKPHGIGPLAPVASNEDEDGRARNRRVELVKILEG